MRCALRACARSGLPRSLSHSLGLTLRLAHRSLTRSLSPTLAHWFPYTPLSRAVRMVGAGGGNKNCLSHLVKGPSVHVLSVSASELYTHTVGHKVKSREWRSDSPLMPESLLGGIRQCKIGKGILNLNLKIVMKTDGGCRTERINHAAELSVLTTGRRQACASDPPGNSDVNSKSN